MSAPRYADAPWIAVLALGGTIASVRAGAGAVPGRDISSLLEEQANVPAGFAVRALQLRQCASSDLALADILEVTREVVRSFDRGAAAVVVVQGTDSIEETAFALELLLDERAPVVVTGAMRYPDSPGSDAAANLTSALDVAVAPGAADQGVLVVMNDEIHSARFVRKAHTSSTAAFGSLPVGPIGWITERTVHIPFLTRRLRRAIRPPAGPVPPVALLSIGPGDDGRLLEAVAAAGYRACVIEAMGGGHAPAALAPALGELAATMPTVLASRTGAGSILERTYAFPGSEHDLLERGLIPAGHLTSAKARVLLSLLLAEGAELSEIAGRFHLYGQTHLPPHHGE